MWKICNKALDCIAQSSSESNVIVADEDCQWYSQKLCLQIIKPLTNHFFPARNAGSVAD